MLVQHLSEEIPPATGFLASMIDPRQALIAGHTPVAGERESDVQIEQSDTTQMCHVAIGLPSALPAFPPPSSPTPTSKTRLWSVAHVASVIDGVTEPFVIGPPMVSIRGFTILRERLSDSLSHMRIMLFCGPRNGCSRRMRLRWRERCKRVLDEIALLDGVSWIRVASAQHVELRPHGADSRASSEHDSQESNAAQDVLRVLVTIGFEDERSWMAYEVAAHENSRSALSARLLLLRAMSFRSEGTMAEPSPPVLKLESKVVVAHDQRGEIPSVEVAAAMAAATAARIAIESAAREAEEAKVKEAEASALRRDAQSAAALALSDVLRLADARITSHLPSANQIVAQRRLMLRRKAVSELCGVLYKETNRLLWYQRRYFFTTDGPTGLALCYRRSPLCEPWSGTAQSRTMVESRSSTEARRTVLLSSLYSLTVTSEVRYEFEILSSSRKTPLRIRAPTRAALDMWVRGLHFLLSA